VEKSNLTVEVSKRWRNLCRWRSLERQSFLKTPLGRLSDSAGKMAQLQMSPITVGLDSQRQCDHQQSETAYKVNNLRRDPRASVCAFTDAFTARDGYKSAQRGDHFSAARLDTLVHLHGQAYGEHNAGPIFTKEWCAKNV